MATSEEKRWAKEARERRQALKRAAPPPSTNLFQARIRREQGQQRPPDPGPRWLLVLLLVSVALWAAWRYWRSATPVKSAASLVEGDAAPVMSSAPVSAVPVTQNVEQSTRAVAATVAEAPQPAAPDSREWQGAASLIKERRMLVVRGRSAWRTLWTEMGNPGEAPRVNFNTHVVAAIFAGPKPGGSEVQIMDVRETETELAIPYREMDAPVPGPGGEAYPFHLKVLQRNSKAARFVKT